MVERSNLISIIALFFLLGMVLGIVWLFWVWTFSTLVAVIVVLPSIAIVSVKWILRDKDKPSRLLGFFTKTFSLLLIGTSIAFFIIGTAPYTYGVYPLQTLVEEGVLFIFFISLFLEAFAIIVYGIFKIRLKDWQVFLSSWYVSMFVFVSYFYSVWRPYQQRSYAEYTGPIHAGALSDVTQLFFVFLLPFLPAVIYTLIYKKFKKNT